MPEESSPQGETFQADAEQAEGTAYCLPAVCLLFSRSRVFHLGSGM